VNWGAPAARRFGGKCRWLNKAVWLNKLDHIQCLQNSGVPTVEWADKPGKGKWYARQFQHIDGGDLLAKLQQGDYYVKHVDTVEEYRVHVFRGEPLRVSRKVREDTFLEPGEKACEEFRIGNGWCFSHRNYLGRVPNSLVEAAVRAVAALGYDFGGVDGATAPKGGVVVFEVNSAPWLGGEMQGAYASRIVEISEG